MSETNSDSGGQRGGAVKGVIWVLGFRLFDRAAGVFSFMLLARLLQPEHFGVVALASSVVALIEILAGLGLDMILIQTKTLTRDHYDTAWTVQVAIATVCGALIALAAYPAGLFFREPRIVGVLYLLAAALAIEGLQNIRMVDFRREMRFDREFIFMASRRTVAVVVTVASALILRNEWALALGIFASRVVGTTLSYLMRPARPRFTLALRAEFFKKSSWLLVANIVTFTRQRSADLALGRVSGAASVGAYTLANDLAGMATQELIGPINRVSFADISQRKSANEAVARFDAVTGMAALVLAPVGIGLSASAHLVVPVLFGPAWLASIPLLQVLALAALVASLASNLGVPIMSLGFYRQNAQIHAIGAIVQLPLLIAGALMSGAFGATIAVLIANIVMVGSALAIANRCIGYGLAAFVKSIWRPIVAAVIMVGAIRSAEAFLFPQFGLSSPIGLLAVTVCTGALAYAPALWVVWALSGMPEGGERRMAALLIPVISRLKARMAR